MIIGSYFGMFGAESDRACLNLLEKEYKWFFFILPLFEPQQTTNALWVHDGITLETHRGSILKIIFIVFAIQGDPWDPKYFNLFGKGKSIDKTPVCISADYPLANEQFNCKCAKRAQWRKVLWLFGQEQFSSWCWYLDMQAMKFECEGYFE